MPSNKLISDPQIAQWQSWLLWAVMGVAILVLIADGVIFARWIAAQLRQNRRHTAYPDVSSGEVAPVVSISEDEILSPSPADVPSQVSSQVSSEVSPGEEAEATVAGPSNAPAIEPLARQEPSVASGADAARSGRPWGLTHVFVSGQVVLVLANILAAIPAVPAMFAYIVRHLSHPDAMMQDPAVQHSLLIGALLSLFVQNALFVSAVALCVRWYGESLRSIGLAKPTPRLLGIGVVAGLALFVATNLLEQGLLKLLELSFGPATAEKLVKFSESLTASDLFMHLPTLGWKLAFLVAAAVAAPIGEEIFFRGFLYNALKRRYNIPIGIVVSGLIFALIHIGPLALLIIFPMGMLLAYMYEKTGSLWVTILMHAIHNGIETTIALWYPHLLR